MLYWVTDAPICPLIFLYSKLAIRKEEEKIKRERKKRNLSTESIAFLVVHPF
jgi:uncharacterized membrane protein YciS (DUF1049 family)